MIEHPAHKISEIRFCTAETAAGPHTNDRGGRDLLRYDTGKPCPIALICLSRLIDLPGDGKRDLVGCWNYTYRPGTPWDGLVCYPRVGDTNRFEFGDPLPIRCHKKGSRQLKFFSHVYMHADFADFNHDRLATKISTTRLARIP